MRGRTWVWIALGVIVLLVVFGGILIALLGQRGRQEVAAPPGPVVRVPAPEREPEPVPVPSPPPGGRGAEETPSTGVPEEAQPEAEGGLSREESRRVMARDFSQSRYESNGQRIFLTGHDLQGRPLSGTGMARRTAQRSFGCANCHQPSGAGGVWMPDGRTRSANITWKELQKDGFDEESLKRAITTGVEPDGSQLSSWMPRWDISGKDLDDLVSYIQGL